MNWNMRRQWPVSRLKDHLYDISKRYCHQTVEKKHADEREDILPLVLLRHESEAVVILIIKFTDIGNLLILTLDTAIKCTSKKPYCATHCNHKDCKPNYFVYR